jgi:hypothetical protein
MYYTVENCTAEQLDELRDAYFWADDTDPETLIDIDSPDDVPDWLLFQQYAGILFVNDDFFCAAGR